MRWWPRRRRPPAPQCGQDWAEAHAARQRAEAQRDEVRSRWPEVHAVADALAQHAEANHFAAAVRAALRGER